ncbi:MAG: histidine kinase N-terminal 7TM domain-containing protein [Anaerovoracaceae bacterium]|jgi:signal transduction histidine kinase|nr:histidine kinase N-terminal 7TM domain-containing protein [Anaerovoracaceae bacterium]
MREFLALEIQTICIVHIVSVILAIIFFMMFYIKANKDPALKWFLIMQISIITWMVFKIFKTVSPVEGTRWGFVVGYYFCTCLFELAFLEFGYSYFKGKSLSNKIRTIIYIFPLLQFLVVITNPYHYLFYKTFDFWGDSFGPLFYVHTGIVYSFVAIGFVYGVRKFRREFTDKKLWYKSLVAAAILLPLVINFLYISRILQKVVYALGIPIIFDISPIAFTWAILAFVYATFKHDFFSLSPILKHEIVHKLDTAICILGSDYKVLYINEKVASIFESHPETTIQKFLNKDTMNEIRQVKTLSKEVEVDDKHLSFYIREVPNIIETRYLVTIKDISSYKHVESEIKVRQDELLRSNIELEKNIEILKETSKVGARTYVARELHDIIGHSLVVTIKLLEVSSLYIHKDKASAQESIEDAIESIDTGIANMESIATISQENYSGKQLESDIKKILYSVDKLGVTTNFILKGMVYSLDKEVYEVLKRVCMELATNSLKHSGASEIFILINIKEDEIDLLMMDNGKGTKNLIKGNGLRGIEDRILNLGGRIHYNTQDGFMVNIKI